VHASTLLYVAAARIVAPVLGAPGVRSVFIRRSVAAGDAEFPLSDLDLGLVIDGVDGAGMAALHRRLRAARALFPLLGEVEATTSEELHDMAESDPYRASLERRAAVTVRGEPPVIPAVPLSPMAVARRLVFWLDHYVPRAARRGRHRDQRKFVLEMQNAMGVLRGWWPEPHVSRRSVRAAWQALAVDDEAPPFVQCCRLAEQAHALFGRPAPVIDHPIKIPGPRPIVLLPGAEWAWPAEAWRDDVPVLTPPALDLLLTTQDPFLWLDARGPLQALGFVAPERDTWIAACLRHAGGERLRRPGFSERGPGRHAHRLARVGAVIGWLEGGGDGDPAPEPARTAPTTVAAHYREQFDSLVSEAAQLRRRARALAAGSDSIARGDDRQGARHRDCAVDHAACGRGDPPATPVSAGASDVSMEA